MPEEWGVAEMPAAAFGQDVEGIAPGFTSCAQSLEFAPLRLIGLLLASRVRTSSFRCLLAWLCPVWPRKRRRTSALEHKRYLVPVVTAMPPTPT